ncbi:acyl-CoA carboxylase subunit epsilon [Streptomyces sp. NPDC006283]|uniref:acyl-CoA carboxylase subunit epsilon n=1 Tax=Streptomyces sp. NPDC006283 TaxID=3156741 RepID=UPI0033A25A17
MPQAEPPLHTVLRIERGAASAEELAAVTATLLTCLAAGSAGARPKPDAARSRALWRREPAGAFRAPHSWR